MCRFYFSLVGSIPNSVGRAFVASTTLQNHGIMLIMSIHGQELLIKKSYFGQLFESNLLSLDIAVSRHSRCMYVSRVSGRNKERVLSNIQSCSTKGD